MSRKHEARRARRREKRLQRRKDKAFFTSHHLTPKSRGGSNDHTNRLRLEWYRHHEAWHKLFKNLTLEEIVACLQRIARMKRRA